jgi:hypothetical protein
MGKGKIMDINVKTDLFDRIRSWKQVKKRTLIHTETKEKEKNDERHGHRHLVLTTRRGRHCDF